MGVHLYQKDPKPVKKQLSDGNFPIKRFCDSIESHMGQQEIHGCLSVPKRTKTGQEKVELWLFPSETERLRDSIENLMRQQETTRVSFGVHLCQKRSKIGQEMAELRLFSH